MIFEETPGMQSREIFPITTPTVFDKAISPESKNMINEDIFFSEMKTSTTPPVEDNTNSDMMFDLIISMTTTEKSILKENQEREIMMNEKPHISTSSGK